MPELNFDHENGDVNNEEVEEIELVNQDEEDITEELNLLDKEIKNEDW